jgi:ubiquinone/menaquinone biosynthesis C-methylase UbiE
MEIEKERLSKKIFLPNWIWLEHNARYFFAAKFVTGKKVIDCACGSGEGTKIFLQSGAKLIHAFDVSKKAISEAKNKCKNFNAVFDLTSAIKLPLQNNTADVYISLETIEHLEQDRIFLDEAKRVLQTSGIFICSTPNRLVTNPGKNMGDKPANKFHIREYSKDEFVSLLKQYFKEVEILGQNPNHQSEIKFLTLLAKLLSKNFAVRTHQLIKLFSYIFNFRKHRYEVEKINPAYEYEYLTAICKP